MAGRNLWLLGIWLEQNVLKKIPFHHRYKEFTDELTYGHVPDLCVEREVPDHVLCEWQFTGSLVASVLHVEGKVCHVEGQVCQVHPIRSRPLFVRRCRLGLPHWTRL